MPAPGDIVIVDDLGSHKGAAVRRVVLPAGAKLFFLPPNSPDPWRAALSKLIEQAPAKLKTPLRKAARRSFDALCACIGDPLDRSPPAECANCRRNSGYAAS